MSLQEIINTSEPETPKKTSSMKGFSRENYH
jgi:hypothetical protein